MNGARVSANLFSTLGVFPALGRGVIPEDGEQAGHEVVVLSHELWVSDFASSPNVIGQTVKISDITHIVIGVMPAGFHYPVGDPAAFFALRHESSITNPLNPPRRCAIGINCRLSDGSRTEWGSSRRSPI